MIVSAIEELDRLTEFLNTSLDVAEARADALRLTRTEIDLDEMMRVMMDLYEPCMSESGVRMQLRSGGAVKVFADAALVHRAVANLLDNELKHLPASCMVTICVQAENEAAVVTVEDDGPGFAAEIQDALFKRRVKGPDSSGRGLGLAFVEAVARAHGGTVMASNRAEGGARLVITLPCAREPLEPSGQAVAAGSG
jgi:signal transduction histidine kinase